MNTPYRSTHHTPRVLKREKTNLSTTSSDISKEPVRVYCRIRPLNDPDDASCISLISPTVLSLNTSADPKYTSQRELHCQFKQIFTSYATQKEVFDFVAMPLLQDLLKGKNALLLGYGVTGSGKTHTLSGEPSDPGIMPRCINTIFNTIGDYQTPKFTVKPDRMNGYQIQSENDAIHDRFLESRANNAKVARGKTPRKVVDQPFYFNDGTRINDVDVDCSYAVFVSYVEIYNNTVYDLLDESNGKNLQPKILREDLQKNMYVIGVTEVEVKSAEEAFEVLNAGQRKKRMGHTLLNAESSRSHSVFNIRLVQIEQVAHNSDGVAVIPDSNLIKISQLSLADLAGSERTNRTQTTGMRLKEAGRINNSLMCLRNCLEILRENQLTGSNKLVPYRDSRLTFLFKNFFEGYGKVEMMVCVNPSIRDYDENLQVMKFAEMSQDIKIKKNEHKDTPFARKTVKRMLNTPLSVTKAKSNSSFTLPKIPSFIFSATNLEETVAQLDQIAKVLKQRSSKFTGNYNEYSLKESNFRRRLCEMNDNYILNSSEMRSMKAIIKKEKQETLDLKNKISDLETVNDSLASKNNELQDVVINLRQIIDEKDMRINQKILEKEKAKQKFVLANEQMSQELEHKLRKQREQIQASMQAKENKLKRVREILESNDTIEPKRPQFQQYEAELGSTPMQEIQHSNRRNVLTPAPRNRRSRSDGEVWLEHNAVKPVPLGTVLQPTMNKRKSLTKLTKASDITHPKQSKYCLIAQNQDTDGEIETKLYKGDIVSTCGGGAQVIFNDVELLKQMSPTGTP
ncbi:kinesin-like protein KIF23 [Coccinella septempunctata]|uniref:kinesin-like protein KIF23 n=1 Tax=Coccinella septempunctata TaxID=41139 RepID=UPI001D073AC6|nr:kinesin-like protein KIF23 [Coccinella septempunctata]